MTRGWITVVALLAASTLLFAQEMFSKSFMGKKPPSLVAAEDAHWLNTRKPVTAESLKGKVVWYEFSFLG